MKHPSHQSNLRHRTLILVLSLVALLRLSAWAIDTPGPNSSPAESLRAHVRYLASDELTGRGVDTPGIKLARDYIAREFARYGLTPAGDNDSYFQNFDVVTGVSVKQPTSMILANEQPLALNDQWTPLGLSASGKAEGEIVFAGYGITVKDYAYDDYAGIDVKGKIVLVLRYEPVAKNANSPFKKAPRYSTYATLRAKVNNARDHGAAAMILVDLNRTAETGNELLSTRASGTGSRNGIIAVQIKRAIAEKWLSAQGLSLTALKEKIDREEQPASVPIAGAKLALEVNIEEIRTTTANVVGMIPGADPLLRNEAVVIGAHYDHLGYGYFGNRDSSTEGQIHHGADDNASGTAVLMQVAERLAKSNTKPARTVIFAAFSGEELGLWGSRHYVNYPPIRLSATKAMLNLDMVGRLRDNQLTVFGTRSAAELSGFITKAAQSLGLTVRESDGVGRSDHMSFYNKKIPAVHFFTGSHADYHRPGDTWEKINTEGMAKIVDVVLASAEKVANTTAPLNFVSLPALRLAEDTAEERGSGAYLGSIPDMGDSEAGVRLAGVSVGSPAALAGLRAGDVIVRFAGQKVASLEDLDDQLNDKKPGDEVEIVVLRGTQSLSLKALLRSRS